MSAQDGGGRPRCVVLGDRTLPGAAAREQAIVAADVEVSATVERWPELLTAVVDTTAEVAVVDLSLTGQAGVRTIAAIRALAPRCRIVAISELRGVDIAAVEAGAEVVVDACDLRRLTAALRDGRATAVQA